MAVQISGNDITVPRDGSFTRNVTIGGTLTYEDVTNIDSVGLVTARTGIEIGARPGVAASISADGNMIVSGISTLGNDVSIAGNLAVDSGSNGMIDFGDITTAYGRLYADDSNGVLIGSKSNHNLVLRTNNTERARIDTSGRLLLGTTTEGHTNGDDLTIATSGGTGITLRSGTSDTGSIFFSDGTSGADEYQGLMQYDHASSFLRFYAAGSEKLRINSSGNLVMGSTTATIGDGIGVLISSSSGARIKLCDSDLGVDAGSGFEMIVSSNGTTYLYNRENTDLIFGTNASERVRITSDGKFGVGLTNPTGQFAVSDGTVVGEINPYQSSSTCFIGTRSNHSVTLKTNATGRLTISTDGYVTTPAQPYCMVGRGSVQSVPSSQSVKILFDTEAVDRGGNFNTSNSRFTAPVAGDYLIALIVQYTQNVNQCHAGIWKNGGTLGTAFDNWVNWGDDTRAAVMTITIPLAASDYIEPYTYHTQGSNMNLEASRTKMTIRYLG